MSAFAAQASAGPVGLIDTDRLGYSGTIVRYGSLADAQGGVNAVDTINVGNRDLALYVSNGISGQADMNIAMGSWWYTTDAQGRAGWGNTRGNTGIGFTQLYDDDSSTDTNIDFQYGGFDGTYYTTFSLLMEGSNAGAADYARLSANNNVNDGGIFHSYKLDLTLTGMSGEDTDSDTLIDDYDIQPGGVSGSYSGIFEITETQTNSDSLGFYVFDFSLNMTNWAYENRALLMTQDAQGLPIADEFPGGNFIAAAAVPEPATLALMGAGLAGIGLARRRKRS